MKVLPGSTDPAIAMAQSSQPASRSAEGAFASLLHDDDSAIVPAQRRKPQEAAGLGMLGVFGRYGAVGEGASSAKKGEESIASTAAAGLNYGAPAGPDLAPSLPEALANAVALPKTPAGSDNRNAGVRALANNTSPARPNVAALSPGTPESAVISRILSIPQGGTDTAAAANFDDAGEDLAPDIVSGNSVSGNPGVNSAAVSNAAALVVDAPAGGVDLAIVIPSGSEEDASAGAPATANSFDVKSRPEQPAGNSDLNVSVLGADKALNVAVSGGIIPDGNSRLREMVESTAAEFGMKVSGLRFNGTDAKSSTAASGDKNGGRTR